MRTFAWAVLFAASSVWACGGGESSDGGESVPGVCDDSVTAEDACRAEIERATFLNQIGSSCDSVPVPELQACVDNLERNGCTTSAFCYFRDFQNAYRACLETIPVCQANDSAPHFLGRAGCITEANTNVPPPVGINPACRGG
jgi:hypothetical protein